MFGNPRDSSLHLKKTVLLLSANPGNFVDLNLDKQVREIQESLQRASQRHRFELVVRRAVRPDDIHKALLDTRPQIVHLCCFGAGIQGLLLDDEDGIGLYVTAEPLTQLFSNNLVQRYLECVVLNANYSVVQANELGKHVDYVIGMRSEITSKAAIKFATGFYDVVGAGESFKTAYEIGKTLIAMFNLPDEHAPMIKIKSDIPGKELQKLVDEMYQYTDRDGMKRRITFHSLRDLISRLPRLAKYSNPEYGDALSDTWSWMYQNFEKFAEEDSYEFIQERLIQWTNEIIHHQLILRLEREANNAGRYKTL